jgi:hypothetical protein
MRQRRKGRTGGQLGIATDPQTGNLVFVGGGGLSVTPPDLSSTSTFSTAVFGDGMVWAPDGSYLFTAESGGVAVVNRSGALVQFITDTVGSGADGMAFHGGTPQFLVSNNNDGSITRYDFPNNDFTMAPTESVFASGGSRGDHAQVGSDGCLYVSQARTQFADGTTSGQGSLVQICGGFLPPVPQPTTLNVNSASNDFADPTSVSAVLTNSNTKAAVTSESVTFTLNGSETCTGTTDATGTASCSLTPGEAAGTYTLNASFAGDGTIQASTGSNTFTVTHEQTSLSYTGATSAVNGQPVTLAGVLTTDDPSAGTALGGKSITFTLGSGGAAQSCAGITDSTGTASCTIASVSQPIGMVPVADSFAGDTFYLPASNSSSVAVFAPTAVGAFVIGNISAGSGQPVEFWGANWRHVNSLSGGIAPSSMKGFADSPTSFTCGSRWTTRTGNSSAPPASIPATIEVIISSKITQVGSMISGNILGIVLVKVDPGYAPAPGHLGTGTIIGTIC